MPALTHGTAFPSRARGWAPPPGRRRRPPFPLLVGAEIDDRRDERAHVGGDLDVVATAERVDAQDVVRRLAAGDRGLGGQTGRHHLRARAVDVDPLGLVAAVERDRVGGAVAEPVEAGEVDVGRLQAGAGEVADGDVVGAAEGAEVRLFDAVEVHGDGGDVAGEAHARAVGRDVDVLADVRAVELQRVVAGLAFDGVAAVAGVPLEGVGAGAELRGVGADVAVDVVVAGPAEQGVGAVAAGDRVIAVAAVDGEVGQRADAVLAGDRVGAAQSLNEELLDAGVVDRLCGGREDADRVAEVAGEADGVVGVRPRVGRGVGAFAAVDDDGDRAGEADAGRDLVVAAEGGRGQGVERGLVAGHRDAPGGAVDDGLAGTGGDGDAVGAIGALRDDAVGRAVGVAVEAVEVDVRRVEVRRLEVADGDVVGAAEGAEVRLLDAVEVHGDGGDVAGDAYARAVGRDVDVLADVRAVELQRVVAGLAFDGVAAVARVPLEGVGAGAELSGVSADVAVDVVVAGPAEQGVGAVAAGDRVIAVAAVDREVRQRADAVLAGDRVRAAQSLDDELLDAGVVDRRCGGREDADRCRGGAGEADGVIGVGPRVGGRIGPVATVHRDRDRAGEGHARVDGVGAAERVDVDVVQSCLVAGDRDAPGGAVDDGLAGTGGDGDAVGAIGALRDDAVGRAVGVAVEAVEVDVRRVEVRRSEVADGDVVGAAEGAEVRLLDAVEVHGDGGDVAGDAHARAVGRDVDVLADVRAVELQRVVAALPFDGVAAVAGVPLEGVGAGAE